MKPTRLAVERHEKVKPGVCWVSTWYGKKQNTLFVEISPVDWTPDGAAAAPESGFYQGCSFQIRREGNMTVFQAWESL